MHSGLKKDSSENTIMQTPILLCRAVICWEALCRWVAVFWAKQQIDYGRWFYGGISHGGFTPGGPDGGAGICPSRCLSTFHCCVCTVLSFYFCWTWTLNRSGFANTPRKEKKKTWWVMQNKMVRPKQRREKEKHWKESSITQGVMCWSC